ncbi:hypothetical protein AcW1_004205 [Taiwanofungus camphoratus]|nr:hypothetical protein AcV5_000587 [Antrodia cinnamomea]KAI0951987.1 hypothetical protein AcV7_007927 [Antrodia cinnamomea]KAI0959359.1 hypothetical protein AcW1_004205 [Antrodia cinnamomea]
MVVGTTRTRGSVALAAALCSVVTAHVIAPRLGDIFVGQFKKPSTQENYTMPLSPLLPITQTLYRDFDTSNNLFWQNFLVLPPGNNELSCIGGEDWNDNDTEVVFY